MVEEVKKFTSLGDCFPSSVVVDCRGLEQVSFPNNEVIPIVTKNLLAQ